MPSKIRLGVLGAGGIAKRFVGDLAYADNVEFAAIASRDPRRADACCAAYGGGGTQATIHSTYDDLLADPTIDAIYVALPTSLHHSVALKAIAAGKHVLCEKPLAHSAQAAREICAAAKAAGLLCMESMWTRFLPTTQACVDVLEVNALGEIVQFHCTLGYVQLEEPGNTPADISLGGGILRDLAVYPISMALHFLGPVELTSAVVERSPSGADRDAAALLKAKNAGRTTLATINASHSSVLSNTLEISGDRGRLQIGPSFISASFARLEQFEPGNSADGRGSTLKRAIRMTAPGRRILEEARHLLKRDSRRIGQSYPGTGLQFVASAFASCISDGLTESPLMPHEQSIRVLEIIEEIEGTD